MRIDRLQCVFRSGIKYIFLFLASHNCDKHMSFVLRKVASKQRTGHGTKNKPAFKIKMDGQRL